MFRTLSRTLAVVVAAGALLFSAAGPASAASPSPGPTPSLAGTASFTGTEHVVSHHTDGSVGRDLTQNATFQVLCTAPGVCTVRVPGSTIELTKGIGLGTIAASGDPCTIQTWTPDTTVSVRVTETGLTLAYHQVGVPQALCGTGEMSVDSQDITFTGTLSAGTVCIVLASCPPPATGGDSTSSGQRVGSTPSVLSALPTAATALTPRNALWAAAAAVILVLLIAIPTQLFNSASEKAGERIGSWWKRTRERIRPRQKQDVAPSTTTASTIAPSTTPVAWSGWPLAALGVLGASVISAFVDPDLSFDAAGLRTVLSILASFVLDVVIGWLVLLLIVRRTHPGAIASFEFKPLTLLVVAGAVLLTRITGFEPGIVFGLVAGIAFAGVIGTAKARVALIGLGYAFAIGVLAWIGYSILTATAGEHPGAVLVFVQETLSSAAIAGMAALPIALLPVGALVGREVWRWNRGIWAAAYAVGLVGFFLVLMPMPFSWQTVPLSLWTWIGLYLLYVVVAIGVWLVVTRPWRKEPAATKEAHGPAAA